VSVSIKHWQDNNTFSYHINGDETPIRFDQIEDNLINLLQAEEDPTFSIYTDETVPVKEVVAVMNIAKRNHYKVIMATSPE
jgi:biopolymer transport protein ExbD